MLNDGLRHIIEEAIRQSRENGDDDEDMKWMAQGAAISYGRKQGLIGDPLSDEEQAAIEVAVKQVMKDK